MKLILKFILTLFLGHENSRLNYKTGSSIKKQWDNVLSIWRNEKYKDFGIERIIRILLALLQFAFPGLYIRDFFGSFGLLWRKIGVEIYVLLKLFIPLVFFKFNLTSYLIVAIVSSYFLIETMLYLATLIYLSNEFSKPISYRRSLTTLFINYFEICLDFAVIYSFCNINIPDFFNVKLANDMQAIYFSFITSATVGYGDITVHHWLGLFLVICQIVTFLIFIALFMNFFSAKVQDPTYFNKPNNDK